MKESGNETFIDALRAWKENSHRPSEAGHISHGHFVHALRTVVQPQFQKCWDVTHCTKTRYLKIKQVNFIVFYEYALILTIILNRVLTVPKLLGQAQ